MPPSESLKVTYNNDGTATLISDQYKNYHIIFDQFVVNEYLKNIKDPDNYYFDLNRDEKFPNKEWIWGITQKCPPGSHLVHHFSGGTKKDKGIIICTIATS